VTTVLALLAVQGAMGGFDTLYYHEWRARLPARPAAVAELRLHAARSVLYALIFGTLPSVAWQGAFAYLLSVVLAAEIAITLADFVVEDAVRIPLGGVYKGERVTHAVMGIVYGAMLAHLVPIIVAWAELPSALELRPAEAPAWLRAVVSIMAAGVLASGIRDLAAVLRLPHSHFPWPLVAESDQGGAR
jgi:hypothetical protein